MGITVSLDILADKVDPKFWQEVYEESLVLIDNYPFMTISQVKKEGFDLLVYTREVEFNTEEPSKRHYSICGDMNSKKSAETFKVYFDLENYKNGTSGNESRNESWNNLGNGSSDNDILLELNGDSSSKKNIFFSKTQGYPYHNYILALGMLFETRLSPHAAVGGYITRGQVDAAKRWADEFLDKPIEVPVRLDLERLQKRLGKYYKDLELIEAMSEMWLGEKQDFFNYILDNFPRGQLEEWFLKCLNDIGGVESVAALEHLILWLNGTCDVKRLAYLCCKEESGPCYEVKDFCEAVAGTWITIPNEKYAFFKYFDLAPGQSDTVETLFVDFLTTGLLAGKKMYQYIPLLELIEILQEEFFEIEKQELEEVIKSTHERVEEIIETLEEKADPLTQKIESGSLKKSDHYGYEEFLLYYEKDETYDEQEKELISQIAQVIEKTLENLEQLDDVFKTAKEKGWNWIICSAVEKDNLIFTEKAWEWVEKEEDEGLLKILLASIMLLRIPKFENEMNFVIRALFENRDFALKVRECIYD